jgi:hypothetical protein
VKQLVDARDNLWAAGTSVVQFGGSDPAGLREALSLEEDQLVELQRKAAGPRPYAFEIRRVTP